MLEVEHAECRVIVDCETLPFKSNKLYTYFVHAPNFRYVEEVGELGRTCDDLTLKRNAMLVNLEGLKRRKNVATEVSARARALYSRAVFKRVHTINHTNIAQYSYSTST